VAYRAGTNLTIIVKAKSYQGECIGTENARPFTGIIVYWLTINGTLSFGSRFGIPFGPIWDNSMATHTIGDDGILVDHVTSRSRL
jgi:hypothetical protein